MLWLFNHKRANFWLPNLGFIFHFSASLNEVLHKGEYNCAEKVFLIHFINMQLTFPEFHFETEAKVDFPSACI